MGVQRAISIETISGFLLLGGNLGALDESYLDREEFIWLVNFCLSSFLLDLHKI